MGFPRSEDNSTTDTMDRLNLIAALVRGPAKLTTLDGAEHVSASPEMSLVGDRMCYLFYENGSAQRTEILPIQAIARVDRLGPDAPPSGPWHYECDPNKYIAGSNQ